VSVSDLRWTKINVSFCYHKRKYTIFWWKIRNPKRNRFLRRFFSFHFVLKENKGLENHKKIKMITFYGINMNALQVPIRDILFLLEFALMHSLKDLFMYITNIISVDFFSSVAFIWTNRMLIAFNLLFLIFFIVLISLSRKLYLENTCVVNKFKKTKLI
jgi:hypothetical protein